MVEHLKICSPIRSVVCMQWLILMAGFIHGEHTREPYKMPLYQEVKKWLMLILASSQSTQLFCCKWELTGQKGHTINMSLSGETAISKHKQGRFGCSKWLGGGWPLCGGQVLALQMRGTFFQRYGGVLEQTVPKDTEFSFPEPQRKLCG